MQVEIYADVVFAINLVMDFFIFWIVNKLIRKKAKFGRLVLGAVVASLLYCMLIFVEPINRIFNIWGVMAIFLLSILICFNPQNLKECIKLIFITNAVAFAIGGAGIGLFYYTNLTDIMGNALNISVKRFPLKILLSASGLSYIFIKLGMGWYRRVIIKKQSFCDLEIYIGDNHMNLKGLIDTGNSLHEPISNKPVIVAEFNAVKDILPYKMQIMYTENKDNDLCSLISTIDDEEIRKNVRIIPFSSIGKSNGMLLGFVADKAEIEGMSINKPVIAIYNLKLSTDGFYNALLSPEIMPEGVK